MHCDAMQPARAPEASVGTSPPGPAFPPPGGAGGRRTAPRADPPPHSRRRFLPAFAVTVGILLLVSVWGLPQLSVSGDPAGPAAGSGGAYIDSSVTFSIFTNQATGSPAFASGPGDVVLAWFAISSQASVSSVTDSAGDHFTEVVNSTMAYGTTGAANGLELWVATSVVGSSSDVLTARAHPQCSTCVTDTAVVVIDVGGVGSNPIDAYGAPTSSASLPNQESVGFSTSIRASAYDFVVAGIGGRNWDNYGPSGADSRVAQDVARVSGTKRAMTMAAFEQNVGGRTGTVWSNGTNNISSAWVASSVALKPAAAPPAPEFTVTFNEGGLGSGTSWLVTLAGQTNSAAAPNAIRFSEPNGTYSFEVGAIAGTTATPAAGTVTVHAAAVSQSVTFSSASRPIQHLVVIVMENQETTAISASTAPYLNYLAAHYASASSFYGVCHGSLPDYMAVTSGRYYACGSSSISVTSNTNIADLVQAHGFSWKAYFESMPSACDRSNSGRYATDHNPFLLYQDIVGNSSRCASDVVNSGSFNASVTAGTLPTVSFYIPNLIDDCHDSQLRTCDHWLSGFLSGMLNSTSSTVQGLMAHTAFAVMFDEGTSNLGYSSGSVVNSWCKGQTGQSLSVCGGHTYLVMVSPYSVGLRDTAKGSQYNVESTAEWLFGLGSDGGEDGTSAFPALSSLFTFTSDS